MARRKQKSCHTCRTRHLRCDGEQPCLHCRRSGRDCAKDSKHIFLNETNPGIVRRRKRYDLSFNGDQMWLDLPSVRFADSAAGSGAPSAADHSSASTPGLAPGSVPALSHSPSMSLASASAPSSYAASGAADLSEDILEIDPSLLNDYPDFLQPFQDSLLLADQPSHFTPEPIPLPEVVSTPLWPFSHYQEALLMRYYVKEVAPWIDVVDPTTHFTLHIPQLANKSPPLLNAIFAIASRHLFMMGKLDESVSLRYMDECYKVLLPSLNEKAFEPDYLATVLILRIIAHMSDDSDTDRMDVRYLGHSIFFGAFKANPTSSLHMQIFFNALKLYTSVSLSNDQMVGGLSVKDGETFEWMETALASVKDEARVQNYRVNLHLARSVNYVYGQGPKTWDGWIELKQISDAWRVEKPQYLNPIFTQHPMDGDPFPKRLFANASYACTHQSYSMARLLLLNSQPQGAAPPDSGVVRLTQEQVNALSLVLLRKMLGAAFSHPENLPINLMAVPALKHSGHLLKDKMSQQQCMNLLEGGKKHCGQVVHRVTIDRLRQVWGWDNEIAFQNVL